MIVTTEVGRIMDDSEIKQEIKRLIVSELDLRGKSEADIADDIRLFGGGLGLDSLDALQLATAMEERFGIRVPDDKESKEIFTSVSTLAAFVANALPK
jgi:acyl carrier protein